MRHYSNIQSFITDKGLEDFLKENNIDHVFIFSLIQVQEIRDIEKKYQMTVYQIAPLQEDTSSW